MEGYKQIESLMLDSLLELRLKGFDAQICQQLKKELEEVSSLKRIIEEDVQISQQLIEKISRQPQDQPISQTLYNELENSCRNISYALRDPYFNAEASKDVLKSQSIVVNELNPSVEKEIIQNQSVSPSNLALLDHKLKEKKEQLEREQRMLGQVKATILSIVELNENKSISNMTSQSHDGNKPLQANSIEKKRSGSFLKKSSPNPSSQINDQQKEEESKKQKQNSQLSQQQQKKHLVIMFEQTGRKKILASRESIEKLLKTHLSNLKLDKVSLVTFDDKTVNSEKIDRDLKNFKLPPLETYFWRYNTNSPSLQLLVNQVQQEVKSDQQLGYQTQGLLIFQSCKFDPIKINYSAFIKTLILGIGKQKHLGLFQNLSEALNGTSVDPQTKKDLYEIVPDQKEVQRSLFSLCGGLFKSLQPKPSLIEQEKSQSGHLIPLHIHNKIQEERLQLSKKTSQVKKESQSEATSQFLKIKEENLKEMKEEEKELQDKIQKLQREIELEGIQLEKAEKEFREEKERSRALIQSQPMRDSSSFVSKDDILRFKNNLIRFIEETQNFKNYKQQFLNDAELRLRSSQTWRQEDRRHY